MSGHSDTTVSTAAVAEIFGRCSFCGNEEAQMLRGPSIDKMFRGEQEQYILDAMKLTGLFDEAHNVPKNEAHVCICEGCAHELSTMFMTVDINAHAEHWQERKVRVSPEIIFAMLSLYVIGQEHAKRALAVAVWEHYSRLRAKELELSSKMPYREVELDKTNILLIGPTGSGKTALVRAVAKYLDVPFVAFDASSITSTGYKGKDAEECLVQLVLNADGDIEAAERGIVYLDEIDKIIIKKTDGVLDIGGAGAQQALLKLIEGANIPLEIPGNDGKKMLVNINTQHILFLGSGAFPGLEQSIERRLVKKQLGFGAKEAKQAHVRWLDHVKPEDLTAYGFINEFSGRFPVIATLDPLTREDLMRVLIEPKDSLLRQYKKLFAMEGVGLEITEDALQVIVEEALACKTGARGLRSAMERRLEKLLFAFPEMKRRQTRLVRIIIDGAYFRGGEPKFEYRKSRTALSCTKIEAEG